MSQAQIAPNFSNHFSKENQTGQPQFSFNRGESRQEGSAQFQFKQQASYNNQFQYAFNDTQNLNNYKSQPNKTEMKRPCPLGSLNPSNHLENTEDDFITMPSDSERIKKMMPHLEDSEIKKIINEANTEFAAQKKDPLQISSQINQHSLQNKKRLVADFQKQQSQMMRDKLPTFKRNARVQQQQPNAMSKVSKKRNRCQVEQPQFAEEEQQIPVQQVEPKNESHHGTFEKDQLQENTNPNLSQNLIPENKFFTELESNIQQFIASGDRNAAYDFVVKNLLVYKTQSQQNEVMGQRNEQVQHNDEELRNKVETLQKDSSVLKKGIQIMNKRMVDNVEKAKHFDELLVKYQQESAQLEMAKVQIALLLKQLYPPQNNNNHNFGGNFGGGPGIC